MPEHIHLLLSEPKAGVLATAIQALKISVARQAAKYGVGDEGRLWQTRYYDHNVRTYESFVKKLRYIHRNPVKRGLAERPEDWTWSSFRHYATGEASPVEIESQWTADRRTGRTATPLSPRFEVNRGKRPTSAKPGQIWGTIKPGCGPPARYVMLSSYLKSQVSMRPLCPITT